MNHIQIAPSLLSANIANLEAEIKALEEGGAHMLHIDVMDGHFVPNLTFGIPLLRSIRPLTKLPLDVHLMIENPGLFIKDFVIAGADRIAIHPEADSHFYRTLESIKKQNIAAGVALNPGTPLSILTYAWDVIDFVLIMSVEPGFAGARFIPSALRKIEDLREILETYHLKATIAVDGGITAETAPQVIAAGATTLIAGTHIFEGRPSSYKERIQGLMA